MGLFRLLSVVTLLCLQDKALAFPNGAPSKSCMNMLPKHGVQQQLTASPYLLTLNATSYSPDDIVEVTLSAPSGVDPFVGFQVRARRVSGDTESLVGNFFEYDNKQGQPRAWYPQSDGEANCATHALNVPKTSVTLLWRAPPDSAGDLEFRAAFVQSFMVFWVSRNAASLTASVASTEPPVTSVISPSFTPITYSECGKSKGCLLYPRWCKDESDCNAAVTYRKDGSLVHFEMMGETIDFVSVTFSDDMKMGNDHTFTCVQGEGRVEVQYGYNPGYNNEHHIRTQLSNIEVIKKGHRVFCRFTRPMIMNLTRVTADSQFPPTTKEIPHDLNQPAHIFIARGDLWWDTDTLGKHGMKPVITAHKVNIADNTIIEGRQLDVQFQIHATFGVTCWLWLAGFSMVIVRYYKPILTATACKLAAWFHVHRTIGSTIFGLAVAGIINIFIKVGGWTKYASAHGIVAMILTSMMLLQLLGGATRPGINSARRPYFNWFHRTSGIIMWILSVVAVFLGVNNALLDKSFQHDANIIVGTWVGFHVAFCFALEAIANYRHQAKGSRVSDNVTPMKLSITEPDGEDGQHSKRLEVAMLVLYCVASTGLWIALIITITGV